MKKNIIDWKLVIGFLMALFLIYLSFESKQVFWYLYTATMLFLISFAIINEKLDDEVSTIQYLSIGILSGVALYLLFAAGNWLISFLPKSFNSQVAKLYTRFSLEWIWHYFVLFLIIIPGEEIFWRGFILKRLMKKMSILKAILASAFLNAIAFCLTGYFILIVAAFVSGLVWGILYAWKRSMPLLIVSHLVFDILLLVFFPLS
ncbi:lysostaphin resistance A-like protein [Lederbergia wuyishanensis]|uniref:Membrane protease YdiL (CAAX protease family) n=1 Tax=Lederbergia wuyishanensis TaxID=1347903 RepID=A0ABU0CZ57_9BACI|nr:type II CAAX endopeptidase family protein [Lederbergia wuyishanensis]MCJ8006069.1 CPBP family intramembrane metalloprotease [Lederbergia wuyishanensis]MDQ0341438.1 membrane protease YdiL (CAAX protease family) [Lederbergia wuyishanensis]